MGKCPITGAACNQPKCIHVTEVGPKYTCKGTKELCVICGTPYMEEESGVVPTTNLPVGMTSLFNVVNSIMKDKNITGGVINFLPPLDAVSTGLEPMDLPKCPKCGFTIENILT